MQYPLFDRVGETLDETLEIGLLGLWFGLCFVGAMLMEMLLEGWFGLVLVPADGGEAEDVANTIKHWYYILFEE